MLVFQPEGGLVGDATGVMATLFVSFALSLKTPRRRKVTSHRALCTAVLCVLVTGVDKRLLIQDANITLSLLSLVILKNSGGGKIKRNEFTMFHSFKIQ
jgi:hypothetical protein